MEKLCNCKGKKIQRSTLLKPKSRILKYICQKCICSSHTKSKFKFKLNPNHFQPLKIPHKLVLNYIDHCNFITSF